MCRDAASPPFRDAAVGRREGAAWHRAQILWGTEGGEGDGSALQGPGPLRRAAGASPGECQVWTRGSVTDDRSGGGCQVWTRRLREGCPAEVAMTPFVPTRSRRRVHVASAGLRGCARPGPWPADARVLWTPFRAPSCP